MKRIYVINHSTRPGVFDHEAGTRPVVPDDVAEWFVSNRHGVILEDVPDKENPRKKTKREKVERAVKPPAEKAVSSADPSFKPKRKRRKDSG